MNGGELGSDGKSETISRYALIQTLASHQNLGSLILVEPWAVGWSKLVDGLAKITVRCNACHAVFRVK